MTFGGDCYDVGSFMLCTGKRKLYNAMAMVAAKSLINHPSSALHLVQSRVKVKM